MNELVSVIIPVYNRESTIVRAIDSVLNQTYKNIEIIVVDDCSVDNTKGEILKKFGLNNRVRYFCLEKNSGACAARNQGVKMSRGRFLAFLDSDDIFLANKIEKQVTCILQNGAQLCATNYIRFDSAGNKQFILTKSGTRKEIYNQLLYCNFITTGTLFGYRECFIETPFDEALPRYQDWDLVLRLCQKYDFCFLIDNTLLQYYQPVSITASTNHAKTLFALDKIKERNLKGYADNKKANAQINWLLGIHSLYSSKLRLKDLISGAFSDGFKLRRILIIVSFFVGFKKVLEKYI